jgi:glycosyltransferase involved in cell wall biosynthesis
MPASSPRVSVVLPFFNAEGSLDRAAESIASQEYEDLECILVDNNSRDRGGQIARSWVEKDPRFRLSFEDRQGVVFASNHGCDLARGEYIARMDADDVALPRRIGRQVEFLDQHPHVGAVAGWVRHVGDPQKSRGFQRYVDWSNSVVSAEQISLRRFMEAPVVNPTAMWRRETMDSHGLYRQGDFPEDYEMWLRWLDRGVRIAKIPEPVLDWYDSAGRLTRRDPVYSDEAFYRIKSRYLARWLREYNPFHPKVWVWGASRISRRRARLLEGEGIRIDTWVDIKTSRQLEKNLVHYADLPEPGKAFLLVYMRHEDQREKILEYLQARQYSEGNDFLLVS